MSSNIAAVLVDGTTNSTAAFEKAVRGGHDSLLIVHAMEVESAMAPPELMFAQQIIMEKRNQSAKEMGEKICTFYTKRCEELGAKNCQPVALHGKHHVCDFMERHNVDTIYVGQRPISATQKFFLGSFSTYILNHCKTNTFVVKHHAHDHSTPASTPAVPASTPASH
eukprot:c3281_g1_i1.p1 GENE.c3281_g1_i1~~c3281_g1_i1.p1  ORF type:complete len:179 (+),score=75.68 c3281_g1_i1:38-538(+)